VDCVVVDGSALARRMIANALRPLGAAIVEAGDAGQALERVGESTAIVIAARHLEGLDGIELVQALRARPDTANVPAMIVAGRATVEDVTRAIEAGATDYVLRPLDPETLRQRVGALLDPARPHRAATEPPATPASAAA
jgi:DNA-binding response OmpR family regulator